MLRIKELRQKHDPPLSSEKLAQLADISDKTVRRAERLGRANSETLRKLAKALGVEMGELFAAGNGKRKREAS